VASTLTKQSGAGAGVWADVQIDWGDCGWVVACCGDSVRGLYF